MRLVSILVLFSAASAVWAADSGPGASYFAQGVRPGWTLEITADRLIFSGQQGPKQLTEAHRGPEARGPEARGDERNFGGERLRAVITPGPCQLVRSGPRYAERVRLTLGKRRLRGCGGPLLPPTNLVGTLWRFSHIGGAPVTDPAQTELRFAERQMAGSVGCNRFGGAFVAGDSSGNRAASLSVGALATTKMACAEPLAATEAAALDLFGQPLLISFEASGAMVLTAANGRSARLIRRP